MNSKRTPAKAFVEKVAVDQKARQWDELRVQLLSRCRPPVRDRPNGEQPLRAAFTINGHSVVLSAGSGQTSISIR
jgi:hypothetical protein